MSFRHTFLTNFIYQADEEQILKIFEKWIGSGLVSKVDERGCGFYAGVFKGLYPEEYKNDLKQVIPKLEKAAKSVFYLVVLPEGEEPIIHKITPTPEDLERKRKLEEIPF